MIYYDFSNFLDIKSDTDTHAVYLSLMDIKLHIIDFNIENSLSERQDIYLFSIGDRKKALTTYNTLRYLKIKIYDSWMDDYFTIDYKNWVDFFVFDTEKEKIILKYAEHDIYKITADWLEPDKMFRGLYNTERNITFDFNISPRRNSLERKYYIEYYEINKLYNSEIASINIRGNHFLAFKEIMKTICNVDLDINKMQECISKKYPDIDINEIVNEEYWSLLKIFTNSGGGTAKWL